MKKLMLPGLMFYVVAYGALYWFALRHIDVTFAYTVATVGSGFVTGWLLRGLDEIDLANRRERADQQ